ncbi:hypothetical protein B0J13DRAFT_567225 [Dactylonectria estremocensis]|uniref:Fungal N-terminal domain-containing protein n=1 Tax=Dactylonectria estremocensis TaxID=1079267 RepID=A0A9P9DJD6_9HYPO|nr:hypothetical protein B0J13DRAFT_567225 [Dactylonectria estremocensis]
MDYIIVASSILSIISSTAAVVSSVGLLQKRVSDIFRVVAEITQQVETLAKVLRDVEEILAAQAPGPDSARVEALRHVYRECRERFHFTAAFLEKYWRDLNKRNTFISRLVVVVKFRAQEEDLRSSYDALRESITLARDLASDLKTDLQIAQVDERINHQLVRLTGAMAVLLDEDADAAELELDINQRTKRRASDGQKITEETQTHFHEKQTRRGGLRGMARIGREIAELTKTNFVTTITLVIETSSEEQNEICQKHIILPGKFDTGSDENLVSYDLLHEQGIREELLIPIPVDKRVELTGVDETFTCTPEWEITLFWWKPTDMKRRQDKFMVVKQAPFEVLFSSARFTDELVGKSVLISKGRYKPKKEILDEIHAEEEKRKKALERVEKEYREAEAKKLVPVRRTTNSSLAERRTHD